MQPSKSHTDPDDIQVCLKIEGFEQDIFTRTILFSTTQPFHVLRFTLSFFVTHSSI